MNTSFTEHVLERARERQKKLARIGIDTTAVSSPNISTGAESAIPASIDQGSKSDPTLNVTVTPNKMRKQNSRTKLSYESTSTPDFTTLNMQQDNLNLEIKVSSSDNLRVEVEIDSDSNESGSEQRIPVQEQVMIRESARNRLQKLGKLYAEGEDLSSPIHRSATELFVDQPDNQEQQQSERSNVNNARKGLRKLADLANNINQWEDDIPTKKECTEKAATPKKSWKKPAPQPPIGEQVLSPRKARAPQPPASKQITWDKAVLDTLDANVMAGELNEEDEDTDRRACKENIAVKQFEPLTVTIEENKMTPRSPKKMLKSAAITSKTALFEKSSSRSSPVKKDPALLSVSERKALFEKNQGEALVPKAAFGMAAPVAVKPIDAATRVKPVSGKQVATETEKGKSVVSEVRSNIAEKIAKLTSRKATTISEKQIGNKIKQERQKEMEVLLNRFNQNKQVAVDEDSDTDCDEIEISETTAMINSKPTPQVVAKSVASPPPPPMPSTSPEKQAGDSPHVHAVLGEVKRIKVVPPKQGHLYPCLSDIEATTETEPETGTPSPQNSSLEDSVCNSDDGGANTSFGREILRAVTSVESPRRAVLPTISSDSEMSDVLEDMNDYLNELDEEEEETDSAGPTPPKQGKLGSPKKNIAETSQSFNYKNCSPRKSPSRFKSPCKIITSPVRRPVANDHPTHVVEGNDVMPLTYTVSFYRKQQSQQVNSNVVKRPVGKTISEVSDSGEDNENDAEVQEKIARLKEEVIKQQNVISQASRALNLCNSTPEFTGSTEQVEAEKLLLVATHRRHAASMEIQRLSVEGTTLPTGCTEKGSLKISNIVLSLKKEYVRALAAAGGKGHHVVCLLKSSEQVVSSILASTAASPSKNPDLDLLIPGEICMENVASDAMITLEVYCLQAQEEILPHEVKYHINKKASNKLTPKKSKHDSRLMRPPKESPAGPQAVRTSSFALNGFVVFKIQKTTKTFTLNKTPSMSPLDGFVTMSISCELNVSVELRGFLNMFEDVSGLGAWHRRWCLLQRHTISYWKYPDDERKKAPIDTIDVRSCITKTVGPVSRDICARLNTFLLERERKAYDNDRETLTMARVGDKTVIKHLLSADTKEERIEWCNQLNRALTAIRMWGGKNV